MAKSHQLPQNNHQYFELSSGKQMHQSNHLPPERMSPEQRISEIATILANAILRLRQTPSTSVELMDSYSNFSLAISPRQSVHVS